MKLLPDPMAPQDQELRERGLSLRNLAPLDQMVFTRSNDLPIAIESDCKTSTVRE